MAEAIAELVKTELANDAADMDEFVAEMNRRAALVDQERAAQPSLDYGPNATKCLSCDAPWHHNGGNCPASRGITQTEKCSAWAPMLALRDRAAQVEKPPTALAALRMVDGATGAKVERKTQKVELRDPKSDENDCECFEGQSRCGRRPAGNFMLEGWPDAIILCADCEQGAHSHTDDAERYTLTARVQKLTGELEGVREQALRNIASWQAEREALVGRVTELEAELRRVYETNKDNATLLRAEQSAHDVTKRELEAKAQNAADAWESANMEHAERIATRDKLTEAERTIAGMRAVVEAAPYVVDAAVAVEAWRLDIANQRAIVPGAFRVLVDRVLDQCVGLKSALSALDKPAAGTGPALIQCPHCKTLFQPCDGIGGHACSDPACIAARKPAAAKEPAE